ncbi:thioredoxin-dependent thiol peroxidase [Paenibacillus sacheonensis]|uniref:thioredoxin-dependent peroxiredoxin n=1 Tax=Paenibacillus sacheonensis TaxID=742054 RepID=A0A7X4YX68_9BACL|nr:thioredoxin-dependent thiol peroxidase [Paenibacillus sacheonensis]MBM7568015.1 peroxiredoxin Q/BCP [Paenibacillus sacheonensis]NBC73221.1 thioredoxin-dependent thiol peroxidase [Paenibacillus sacheonensis]
MAIKAKAVLGKKAPDFKLPAGGGREVSLSQYVGHKVVLFFYPKDMTPACTQESCDFRDAYAEFGKHDTVVLGISNDPAERHEKFAEKYELPFELLADTEHRVCELYGVWQLKKLYGREYMGLVRSTFLIDEKGKLVREWRNLRVKGHVQDVLAAALEL